MNYFYNFSRKEISGEEIASRMDFGKVLSNYKIVTKPFYKTGWFGTTATLTLVGIAALVYFNSAEPETNKDVAAVAEADKNKITYKEDSPCIRPPQQKSDIPFESYQINAAKDSKIIHSTGTEISIPANAFSKNGEPVSGEIEIKYREFHDMADCILSGIPMTYDSAGTKYDFESAGMIEIRAFQDGEPVDLEKNISVSMVSDYNETKYNLYYLDENEKNWVCIGKDKVTELHNDSPALKKNDDKIAKEIVKKEEKLAELKKEIVSISKDKPEEPVKRNPSNYSFTLDVLAEEFPELSEFSATRFEVSATDKNFTPKHFQTEWEDVKLQNNAKTEKLQIVLSKGTNKKYIDVYPVYEGADYKTRKEKFDKEYKSYSQKLESRLNEEKKIEDEIAELRKATTEKSNELSEQWAEKRRQNGTLIPDNGVDFYSSVSDPKVTNMRAMSGFLTVAQFRTRRSFDISGQLGVVNVDCGVSRPIADKGKKRHFRFRDKNGNPVLLSLIYIIAKKRNVMFTYQPDEFKDIRMQEKEENYIVGITEEGHFALVLPADLKVVDWDQPEMELKMRIVEKVNDAVEFKKMIFPNV